MRSTIVFFSFFILIWQAIVISNTIHSKLETRTEYIHQLLKDI